MEKLKLTGASNQEILWLLRAFFKIGDPRRRREIVTQVQRLAFDQTSTSGRAFSAATNCPRTEQVDSGADLSF
jgi:hypothetical protein